MLQVCLETPMPSIGRLKEPWHTAQAFLLSSLRSLKLLDERLTLHGKVVDGDVERHFLGDRRLLERLGRLSNGHDDRLGAAVQVVAQRARAVEARGWARLRDVGAERRPEAALDRGALARAEEPRCITNEAGGAWQRLPPLRMGVHQAASCVHAGMLYVITAPLFGYYEVENTVQIWDGERPGSERPGDTVVGFALACA